MAVAIYLLCLLIAGDGVAAPLARDRSRLEIFGLAACIGPGIIGLWLIALSIGGLLPSRLSIAILTICLGTCAFISLRKRIWPNGIQAARLTPGERWWNIFCIVLLASAIIVTTWNAFVNPPFEWDAFSIWQL